MTSNPNNTNERSEHSKRFNGSGGEERRDYQVFIRWSAPRPVTPYMTGGSRTGRGVIKKNKKE